MYHCIFLWLILFFTFSYRIFTKTHRTFLVTFHKLFIPSFSLKSPDFSAFHSYLPTGIDIVSVLFLLADLLIFCYTSYCRFYDIIMSRDYSSPVFRAHNVYFLPREVFYYCLQQKQLRYHLSFLPTFRKPRENCGTVSPTTTFSMSFFNQTQKHWPDSVHLFSTWSRRK